MSKTLVKAKEISSEERSRFVALSRKMVLATVGAVGIAQDEIDAYLKRLVERGELSEKQARKMLDEVSERSNKVGKHAGLNMEHQIEKVLHRANVPTRHDIEALSAKITTLTHKVEEMNTHKAHV
jgi:polyhydroxyalkanoate synthesis regulator phasin